jgi:drug/metabolite transporter (DMT)-like permease
MTKSAPILALLLVAAPITAFVAPGPIILSSRNALQPGRTAFSSLKSPEDQLTEILDDSGSEEQASDSYDPFQFGNQDDEAIPATVLDTIGAIEEDEKQKIGIWAARGILLAVAMLWGTNFASVKYLETLCFHPPCNHPPSEAALARFGIAALVAAPLLIGQRKDIILAGLECGLWITLGYITQAMALEYIPSGKCAFICSLTVVVVPIISAFFGKPIKAVNVASAAVALTGVGVLEGMIDVSALVGAQPALADTATDLVQTAGIASSSLTEASAAAGGGALANVAASMGVTKGDLLALGQPFGFGLSFMRIEHYVEKFEDVENRIMTISAAQCVAVGFFSLLWVLHDFHGTIPDFGYMVR